MPAPLLSGQLGDVDLRLYAVHVGADEESGSACEQGGRSRGDGAGERIGWGSVVLQREQQRSEKSVAGADGAAAVEGRRAGMPAAVGGGEHGAVRTECDGDDRRL